MEEEEENEEDGGRDGGELNNFKEKKRKQKAEEMRTHQRWTVTNGVEKNNRQSSEGKTRVILTNN